MSQDRPKKGIKGALQNWQGDLGAAFGVALIALPLCLSLAMASGVPPMAGIISSVVGGIIVAIFGGSFVTITGPGNGLVVVILGSVMTLGGGDMAAGYLYTLAAVIVSGAILLLFGFLRLGDLGDFFPSASIQGLLAAIGFIFIAKQFHVMIGVPSPEEAGNIELLMDIPFAVWELFKQEGINYVAIIGTVSFLIMAFYPKIKARFFHAIPAPMWVVVLTVGFAYYFEWFNPGAYPIDKGHLINIPDDVFSSISFPDFGKVFTSDFMFVVIGITLIASVESLLSIKAVDKLDPYKRRSNINRDLKALGLGSMISGAIGGLPVVTVIARSSVNVHNGAKTRASNMYHAVFLLLIVFLLQPVLKKIPLSALAGILVYTGYKLASPSVFQQMYNIGKEQLFIFVITLVSAIAFGLIEGVAIGIGVTLIIQFFLIHPKSLVLRNPLQPNTLMYQEDDGKFYVGVKAFSNFLNYLQLKKQLDSIPRKQHVILDFSLTNFVDHTVMEHIAHYADDYRRRGGQFEVIGLDVHDPATSHPFAARRVIRLGKLVTKSNILTSRQEELKKFAKEIKWDFKPNSVYEVPELEEFPLFKTKSIDHIYNTFSGRMDGIKFRLFDAEYYEGEFIAKEVFRTSMLLIKLEKDIPEFTLDKEGFFHRVAELAGFSDINIKGHDDFSHRFLLQGDDKDAIIKFFNDELVLFFESNPYYHIQSDGKSMLIFKKERLASISEVKALLSFGKRLARQIKEEH